MKRGLAVYVAAAIVCTAGASCAGERAPLGYLPAEVEGSVVGEIVDIGEGLTSLEQSPGVLDMLVESRPVVVGGACTSRFFSVGPDSDVTRWREDEQVGPGSTADLEIGRFVRVRPEGACFGSCPGLCRAATVEVFVK